MSVFGCDQATYVYVWWCLCHLCLLFVVLSPIMSVFGCVQATYVCVWLWSCHFCLCLVVFRTLLVCLVVLCHLCLSLVVFMPLRYVFCCVQANYVCAWLCSGHFRSFLPHWYPIVLLTIHESNLNCTCTYIIIIIL
jgi:hypothetical protein